LSLDGLRLISHTNTQVRNLVVCRELLLIIGRRTLPISLFKSKALEWNRKQLDADEAFRRTNGHLVSKNKATTAFDYYLNLLQSLHLITRINEMIRLSKYGSLLGSFFSYSNKIQNTLSISDSSFLLYFIMKHDADNMLLVMEVLLENGPSSYKVIQSLYQPKLQARLTYKTKRSDLKSRSIISDKLRVVAQEWKRAETYSYHIIPPRIEWLLALNFVEKTSGGVYKFMLNQQGRAFLNSTNFDPESQTYDIDNRWLENSFMKSYYASLVEDPSKSSYEIRNYLGPHLSRIYNTTHDDASFRLSTWPTLLAIAFTINSKCQHIVEIGELYQCMLKKDIVYDGKRYSLRSAARTNESYINVRIS
jgi:hypothetical protein